MPYTVHSQFSTVDVMFRKHKKEGDIVAVFPGMAGDSSISTCGCYQHIGQHGACSVAWVLEDTRPATPEEYAPLLNELKRIGYGDTLRIVKRMTQKHVASRRAELCHSA